MRAKVLTGVLAGALLLTGGVATSVSAVPTKDIQQVQAEVQDLEMKAEAATERANAAQIRLEGIQSDLAAIKNRSDRERAQLKELTGTINDIARAVYASGGFDPALQVLLADDPAEFLAQAAVMGQLEQSQVDQLRQTTTARLRLAQTEAEITDREGAAAQATADMKAAQDEAAGQLQAAQDVLSSLQADERRRLEELARQARAEQVAAAAAAAADARRQAASGRDTSTQDNSGSAQDNGASSQDSSTASQDSGTSSSGSDTGSSSSGGQDSGPSASGGGFSGGTKAMLAVQYALAQVGDNYVAAAAGPNAFDCSGLTMAAYRQAGVSLPHLSYAQYDTTRHVPVSDIQLGDLVFYFGSGAHHVGIYVGNGKMVSASNPSAGVQLIDFLGPWYNDRFSGVGRVVG
jgi:cell wall-associated NlpC family hydrolase/outer membrane murein-binding lipoprotein Lpp